MLKLDNKTILSDGSQPSTYLKSGVRWRTRPFFFLGTATIVWLGLGMPRAGLQLPTVASPTWIIVALTTVLSVVVMAVDSAPGTYLKAVLVFWRRRDPLPGSRAFDLANMDRDARIDRDRLRGVLDGKFPRGAKDQNAAWYRLYKSLEKDQTIRAMHTEYLLFRDLAWLSVVLSILALLNLVLWPPSARLLAISAFTFGLLYLLFRRAGFERGHRLVNQVLVTASLKSVKKK